MQAESDKKPQSAPTAAAAAHGYGLFAAEYRRLKQGDVLNPVLVGRPLERKP